MSISVSGISKFLLGFALAIALLFAAGVGTMRYILTRVATPPPKPVFANDPSPVAASPAANPAPSPATAAVSPNPGATPAAAASPSAAGSYAAKVTQPIGLIVRQDPSADAPQVGGIDYNQQLTVLEDSPDGAWQKVKLESGSEGWVKGGNTERVN
jgi:hypothetical protein